MSPPAILDLQSGIQRRLRDVDSFQIPRLRDCGGPLSLHTELANETRNDIQVIEGMIEVRTFGASRPTRLTPSAELGRFR